MMKRILFPSGLGAAAVLVWMILINGILGLQSRVSSRQPPAEQEIHQLLKAHLKEPGSYVCNPPLLPEGGFPAHEPVFGITQAGFGHEAAGAMSLKHLGLWLVAMGIACGLLAMASDRVRSTYAGRFWYLCVVGILVAMMANLGKVGIGGMPWSGALMLGASDAGAWALAASLMAWRTRP